MRGGLAIVRRGPKAASALAVVGLCAFLAASLSPLRTPLLLKLTGRDATLTIPSGKPFPGLPAVGALFTRVNGVLGKHFCTASVVHSPHGNLLITAAHCLLGKHLTPPGSVVFAPGFHAGKFPHGIWQVAREFVDQAWSTSHNPNDDVAFLVAGRPHRRIENYTGAEVLATHTRAPETTQVIGYPNATDLPITCTNRARNFDPGGLKQLVFRCRNYTNGTSGGPFLINVDSKTGNGSIVGVIGGYEEGGFTPDVSYSPKFLNNIAALYQTAAASS